MPKARFKTGLNSSLKFSEWLHNLIPATEFFCPNKVFATQPAIDRSTGQVLAYVFGKRMTKRSFNLRAYLNLLASKDSVRMVGVLINDISQSKCMRWANGRPKGLSANIFGSELELSGLLVRLSVFPNLKVMHDLVIGLFINRYEFGRLIHFPVLGQGMTWK